jgi:hypothetical protein
MTSNAFDLPVFFIREISADAARGKRLVCTRTVGRVTKIYELIPVSAVSEPARKHND